MTINVYRTTINNINIDKPNTNGRIYSLETIVKAFINSSQVEEIPNTFGRFRNFNNLNIYKASDCIHFPRHTRIHVVNEIDKNIGIAYNPVINLKNNTISIDLMFENELIAMCYNIFTLGGIGFVEKLDRFYTVTEYKIQHIRAYYDCTKPEMC